MTRAYAAILTLLLACSSDPMGLGVDAAMPPPGDAATDSAMPAEDASAADAGRPETDAAASDAATADAATPTDAGTVEPDAGGPPPSCDALGALYDPPLGVCVYRWLGTSCPSSPLRPSSPLQWTTTADQHRLEGYLGTLGGSGGVPLRKISGSWQWVDGSPTPSIDWAETPGATDPYAYLRADGMRSYFRAYAYQLCSYEP